MSGWLALGSSACAVSLDETEDEQANAGSSEQGIDVNALLALTITPPDQRIDVNQTAFYDVEVEALDGFSGNVFLDVMSEPAFVGDVHILSNIVTPPAFVELHAHGFCETQPGTYNLTVIGTADDGSTTSSTAVLTVDPALSPPPNASFFTDRDGFTVRFFDSSFASGCANIVSWAWDFGDGAVSTERSPTHTYSARGNYTVTLTVTDSQGQTDTETESVLVLPPPPVLDILGVTRIRERFDFRVDLEWSGAEGDLFELYRNNAIVDLPDNDGEHRDRFRSLQTSFRWEVCELRIPQCSNEVRLDVAPNPSGEATVTTRINGQTIVSKIRIQDE